MDTRTGTIYESREQAHAAGVPDEHLVTGPREELEPLSAIIRRANLARAQARGNRRPVEGRPNEDDAHLVTRCCAGGRHDR